jgi:hypothetical protein
MPFFAFLNHVPGLSIVFGNPEPPHVISVEDEQFARKTALHAFHLALTGKASEAQALFIPSKRFLVTDAIFKTAFASIEMLFGPYVSMEAPILEPSGSDIIVKIPLHFERGPKMVAVIPINSQRLLTGFRIKPAMGVITSAWKVPSYANPKTFNEEEVKLSAGNYDTRGTLSVPNTNSTAGVILLGGSGPTDQDGTLGHNKILKDLAWGLASNGISVLRFDSVTSTNADKIAGIDTFTMTDEYVPHALAAVKHMHLRSNMKDRPIFCHRSQSWRDCGPASRSSSAERLWTGASCSCITAILSERLAANEIP